jgi:hypothetical protein
MYAPTQVTHLRFLQVSEETRKQLIRLAEEGNTASLRRLLEGENIQLRLAMVRISGQMVRSVADYDRIFFTFAAGLASQQNFTVRLRYTGASRYHQNDADDETSNTRVEVGARKLLN